jgi:CRP-like cAMP-binding protein
VKDDLLDWVPLFADLSAPEKATLAAGFVERHCEEGTVLLKAGEPGDTLYLLVQGFVGLTTPGGQSLATLGPNSLIGEAALFRNTVQDVNVTALSALELWELTDSRLREILHSHPAIGLRLRQKLGSLPVQMKEYLLRQLGRAPALAGLPAQPLHALAAAMTLHEVKAGDLLARAGEVPVGFLLLESGEAELQFPGKSAKSRRGERVQPGVLIGALSLLVAKPYVYNAVAIQECLVWQAPAEEFRAIAVQHPALRRTLARHESSPLSEADQRQAQSQLARLPLWAELPQEARQAIAAALTLHHVAAGERIYTAGQASDALYLIEEGEVALSAESIGGLVEESARIRPGGFFGERAMFCGQPRGEDATALRHTNLWVLNLADLHDLAGRYPAIGNALEKGAAAYRTSETPDAQTSAIRQMALFAELTQPELQHIAACLHPVRLAAGALIYPPGSPGETLYLLKSGQVRIQPPAGGSWLVGPGEAFGERALLHNQPHNAGAVAESDVELWTLNKDDFTKLTTRYPSLAINLSRLLSQRLAQRADETRRLAVEAAYAPERRQHARMPVWAASRAWFANLTVVGKLRTAGLLVVVLWGIGSGVILALNSLRGNASAAGGLDVRSAIRAVQSMGSYELALQDKELAQALALADRLAPTAQPPTPPPSATPTPLPTATPTNTPLPTSTPTKTATPVVVRQAVQQPAAPPTPEPQVQVAAQPPRAWDARLDRLGAVVEEPNVPSGQPYWRLVEARWQDEQESGGKHHIYVEVIDENGNRIVGQPVTVSWADGSFTAATEDKAPPDYAYNYQMYATGNAYHVKVEGLPSEILHGAGLGDLERPRWSIHTSYLLTFQRTTKP